MSLVCYFYEAYDCFYKKKTLGFGGHFFPSVVLKLKFRNNRRVSTQLLSTYLIGEHPHTVDFPSHNQG